MAGIIALHQLQSVQRTDDDSDDDEDRDGRRLIGRVLLDLREQAGLTQQEAGRALGTSGQNWQKYEAGMAPGVFRPSIQRRLAAAVGSSLGALRRACDDAGAAEAGYPPGVAEAAAGFEAFPTEWRLEHAERLKPLWAPGAKTLTMPDDSLRPWANSGCVIVYQTGAWPGPEEGCVVETGDGRLQVGLFVRAAEDAVHLRMLHPRPRQVSVPRTQGAKLHRVIGRID
ncbi:MAG: helix-turn-helix transcriptional regulator [Caulobacteraceae bacterium]